MTSKKLKRVSYVLTAAILGAMPMAAWGQQAQMQPAIQRGGLNPDSFYGKESFQGVSVRDSLEAIKKLEDARRMERLEDWNKAADWYQEVIEKFGDRVVPSSTDAQNNIRQYTGIERPVQEQLAKWPKSGLDAYANRYGAVATGMLDQARRDDRETLSKIMKLYFITEAGKQAGVRLVDLLLENGEFAEAARVADRLLDWHPNLVVERPKVLFRAALAYHLSGDEKKSKDRSEQLKNKFGQTVGTIFGKDVVLSDAMEELGKIAPPVSVSTATNSIRMSPGGNEERSMISSATGRPGARMASIELSPPNIPQAQLRAMEKTDQSAAGLGIMPVVDEGEMYFQDGSRVYAVSLQSGVPLPGWFQSYPATGGQYSINSYSGSRSEQYTLTLTDHEVLGVMGASERLAQSGAPIFGSDRGTRLVCLDRATGREKWAARPNKIAEENLKALDFSGSPLVVGDNVYVVGRGGKNFASEDCYVLCFDINTGNYKWSCFIASSNNAMAYTGQPTTSDTLSHLAYSSGRIFVLTNLGACAALDAYSGTVSWLNIYPRDNSNMMNDGGMGWRGMGVRGGVSGGGSKAWEFNPVIVKEGKVFLLPSDGKHIVVYDAGSGAEVVRLAISDIKLSDDVIGPRAIIGVDGNQMIMTGGAGVYCIDWTKPAANSMIWHCPFPTAVKGRGFVTADSVFVCSESGKVENRSATGALWRIERATGKRKESYPQRRDWDTEGGEGPGNILVTGDQVIVAGAKRVNVYADMALARKRLDDDVAAAPVDPEPRLRYAEVMFVAGQLPVAMEKMDEAIKLLGGLPTLRPGPERDHLFNDCITFAMKLQKDKKGENIEETLAAVDKLYDLASASADGDSQQVNYRISRAKFNRDFRQEGSLENAVKLYQEILTVKKLRIVPLADDENGASQAAIVAEKSIAEVKKIKASAYDSFEKIAVDALAAAGDDPESLKSVAESYPNSSAAPKAMVLAAGAYEKQMNYRLAAHTTRQVYNKYGESADRSKLLEAMARNYLAMSDQKSNRLDTAAARLATIVKLGNGTAKLEKPLKLPGEKVLAEAGATITEALKAVQNYKTDAQVATLPDFHVTPPQTEEQKAAFSQALADWRAAGADPAKKPKANREPFIPVDQQLVVDDIAALVDVPRDMRQTASRHDRVVTWSNGNLVVFPVGSKDAAGRSSVLTDKPANLAWTDGGKQLLVWGNTEIAMLNGENADKKWKLELKSLPKTEVIAGGKGAEDTVVANDDPNVQQQVIINGGQRMIIRRNMNGRFIQQIQQPIVPAAGVVNPGVESITQVRIVDDKVVVSTSAGQLFALKASDGSVAWQTRLASNAPISRVVATDDFTVAKVDDASNVLLVVTDTLTGQLVKRMSFSTEQGNAPVNIALAADGMLVYTQPDRICGKDLFEPRKELNYEVIAGQNDAAGGRGINAGMQMDGQPLNPIFAGAINPDQLMISEGRIIALSHNGKFVSLHSLETGKLLDYQQPDGRRADARLSTVGQSAQNQIGDWSVALNVVGQYLYVTSRNNGPVAYNLDHPEQSWQGTMDPTTQPNISFQDPMIGQDFVVIMGQPARKVAAGAVANPVASTYRLHAYSRASLKEKNGRESGLLVHQKDVRDDAGITDWVPVDGGFYYLTADKKMHYLKGGRPQ